MEVTYVTFVKARSGKLHGQSLNQGVENYQLNGSILEINLLHVLILNEVYQRIAKFDLTLVNLVKAGHPNFIYQICQ